MKTLENEYLRDDKSCYLTDVNKTYELLINWKNNLKNISIILEDNTYEGILFLQTDTNTKNSMKVRG